MKHLTKAGGQWPIFGRFGTQSLWLNLTEPLDSVVGGSEGSPVIESEKQVTLIVSKSIKTDTKQRYTCPLVPRHPRHSTKVY